MMKGVFYIIFGLVWISVTQCACGKKNGGVQPVANDPVPQGFVVSQGSFEGVNGKIVTGSASVFKEGDSLFTLRLNNVSIPNEGPFNISLKANGAEVFSAALKSLSGNQNYQTGISASQNWTSVNINAVSKPSPGNEYGAAVLSPTSRQ